MSLSEYSKIMSEPDENSNFVVSALDLIEDSSKTPHEKILCSDPSQEKSARNSVNPSPEELKNINQDILSINNLNDMNMQFLSIQTREKHQDIKSTQRLKVFILSAIFFIFVSILIGFAYQNKEETTLVAIAKTIQLETPFQVKIRECFQEDIFYNQNICMDNEDFCTKFSQNNLSISEKNEMMFEEYKGWSFNENRIHIEVLEIIPLSNCKIMFTKSKNALRFWNMDTFKPIMYSFNNKGLYEISPDEEFVICSDSTDNILKFYIKSFKVEQLLRFYKAKPTKILISDDSRLILLMFENVTDILVIDSKTLVKIQAYVKFVGEVTKIEIDGPNNDVLIQDSEGIKICTAYSNECGIIIKNPQDLKKWQKVYFKLNNFK